MYPNQNYQIPFNQFLINPGQFNFSQNNAPMVNIGAYVPETQPLIPILSATCANEVCAESGKNTARVYVFNKLSMNGFNNDAFAQMVSSAYDIVNLEFMKARMSGNSNLNIQGIVGFASKTAVSIYSAYEALNNQQLLNSLDHNSVNDCRNILGTASALTNEINNMKNSLFSRQQMQPSGYFNSPTQNQHGNVSPRSGYGVVEQPVSAGSSFRDYGSPGLKQFEPVQTNIYQQTTNNAQHDPSVRTYGRADNFQPVQQQNTQQVPSFIQKHEQKELSWSPSPLQRHKFLIDPLFQKIKLVEVQYENTTYVVQEIVDLTEEEMDRAKHTLGFSSADFAAQSLIKENIFSNDIPEDFPDQVRTEMAMAGQGHDSKVKIYHYHKVAGLDQPAIEDSQQWSDVGFLADAIHATKASHISTDEYQNRILRDRFVVPKVFVTNYDVGGLFTEAIKDKSFKNFCAIFKAVLDNAEKRNKDLVDFIRELDVYLTVQMNDFISDIMSLPTVWIDSFFDDVPTLSNGYFKEKYGVALQDIFDRNEETFFNTYLKELVSQEERNRIIERISAEDVSSDVFNKGPYYVILELNYTITSARLFSKDLRIETNGKDAFLIGSSFPILQTYCENLFNNPENKKYNWAGHLFVTSDGKVYNFMKSPYAQNSYLVNKFNLANLLP
jgi:hypothetical protein